MRLRACFALAVGLSACSAPSQRSPETSTAREAPIEFAFGVLDGSVLTNATTHGRVTALLFVTTFDLPSQAAARRLGEVQRRHAPRFNAAAIALESAENAPLVAVFRDTLELSYPVAITNRGELRASSAFADVDRVPTLILLDRYGRPVLRHYGVFEPRALEAWLRDAER
jgi:hypothetical protein